MDREKASTQEQQVGPPWLTVEFGLYLLLVLVAAFLRFYALGSQSLQEGEAQLGLDAWRFYTGGAASIRGHSPLLFHGNVLLYLLFGANDAVPRLIPALAGSLIVGLPYLLRGYVGRRGAMLGAALLAISPSFVFFSRQLNGDIIVLASALVLLAGIFRYVESGKTWHLCLVAAAVGLALMAGGASYAMLLCLGASFLALLLRSRLKGGDQSLFHSDPFRTTPSEHTGLKAAGVFAALLLLVSTGLFVNPQGLQATLDLLPAWLSQFAPLAEGHPWHYYPSLLLAYELPALVFGLAGACYLARRDLFSLLLTAWFGGALVLYSVMGTKPPAGLLQMLLPLTLLAGKAIGELLTRMGESNTWTRTGLVLVVSIPMLFHILLQSAAFANPANPGDPRHLILAILSLFFLLSILLITGALAMEWSSAFHAGGLILLLGVAVLTVHTTFRLNYHSPGNPFELLVDTPTSPDVRNLVRAIEDLSNQQERDRHSIDITVAGAESPLLAWYLREFPDLAFASDPASPFTPVVITPFDEPVSLPEYRGARFRLQSSWQPENMTPHTRLAWYLYAEAVPPPTHREVVMWVAP